MDNVNKKDSVKFDITARFDAELREEVNELCASYKFTPKLGDSSKLPGKLLARFRAPRHIGTEEFYRELSVKLKKIGVKDIQLNRFHTTLFKEQL